MKECTFTPQINNYGNRRNLNEFFELQQQYDQYVKEKRKLVSLVPRSGQSHYLILFCLSFHTFLLLNAAVPTPPLSNCWLTFALLLPLLYASAPEGVGRPANAEPEAQAANPPEVQKYGQKEAHIDTAHLQSSLPAPQRTEAAEFEKISARRE